MCVAIPGQVKQVLERTEFSIPASVRFPNGTQQIDLVLVPDAGVGDWVIAHSGYAVSLAPASQLSPLRGQSDEVGRGVDPAN